MKWSYQNFRRTEITELSILRKSMWSILETRDMYISAEKEKIVSSTLK